MSDEQLIDVNGKGMFFVNGHLTTHEIGFRLMTVEELSEAIEAATEKKKLYEMAIRDMKAMVGEVTGVVPMEFIDDRWYTEDVIDVRPDLSHEQAWEVLKHIKKTHDATVGINWEVIDIACDILYPLPEEEDDEE
jgi:hypothetical protein